jgi:hypothetical protein
VSQMCQRIGLIEEDASPLELLEEQAVLEEPQWLQVLRAQLDGLRFGTIQITVHEGRIVQIDRTQRTRLDGAKGGDAFIR